MAANKTSRPSAAKLARTNPKVDLDTLRAAQRALADLRRQGLPKVTSTVRTPYGQRSIKFSAEDATDGDR